jgi:[protein-PII] uridylyltransferase
VVTDAVTAAVNATVGAQARTQTAAQAAAPTVESLSQAYRQGKKALIEHFLASRATVTGAASLTRQLTRLVDNTLAQLWAQAGMPSQAALVAVGGYGRGELFPHSDVDVLVLLPTATRETDALRATVSGFITACWDVGLEIGSSVRTLDECIEESARDQTVQTAVLENRQLCGARKLYEQFTAAHTRALDPLDFFRVKTSEMKQRHHKYSDTPYALEPNCKESPGGLRDLQVVMWVARAAGLGRTWNELANKGLITPFEVKQLQRNEGLIKLIRARLHAIAGRREDRLVFDVQTTVAESFGYVTTPAMRASEKLMRRYYWAAKAVTQLNAVLMLNIEDHITGGASAPLRPINERFFDKGGMLEVASDDLYERHPHAVLETFNVFQREVGITGLSARTLRALYNARHRMNGAFRSDPVNRSAFMAILQAPEGHTHALRLMNATSVLGRYLWVFRRIVGQMQHDLFHVYTVDQHILMVVRNMRRFAIAEHAHEYPFCSQLMSQFDRHYVLYVAALFHDVAKGRGGDHSKLGTVDARKFCRDHGVDKDDARLIEFLVLHHLTMSQIAQKEDISDPDVVARFVGLVKDERTLTALYLLTVADIRGTSPKVWNAWKGKLLEDLYRITLRALGGGGVNVAADAQARKREARAMLALASQLPGTETDLWSKLEVAYFMRHDAAEIAWHARVLRTVVDAGKPVVHARASSVGEGLQVLVYAPDQADLFARVCGYFDRAGYSIHDAKVHTTRHGYALDTFQVTHLALEPDDVAAHRDVIALIETDLTAALTAQTPLPEPSRGRVSRRVKSFPMPARVSLRPDESAQRWLLSVSASDRSGLLYAIARVLSQHHVNIQLAKVSTLGERVEDTFLLDGPSLNATRTQAAIETELMEALEPLAT